MLLLTARFLLLFLLLLSTPPYFVQAEECNQVVVSQTKVKNGYDMMKESSEGSRRRKARMVMGRQGFVAFNADYKGPRHHPPKNN